MSVINITDLTFAYEGSYDNIFEHVSFHIDTDWKLGFTGRNGRGKTTFLSTAAAFPLMLILSISLMKSATDRLMQ